jgi:hypothetical protein
VFSTVEMTATYWPIGNYELDNYLVHSGDYFTVFARPAPGSSESDCHYVVYDRKKINNNNPDLHKINGEFWNNVYAHRIASAFTEDERYPHFSVMTNSPESDDKKRLYVLEWKLDSFDV